VDWMRDKIQEGNSGKKPENLNRKWK
jgi:hypothetical protein